MLKGVWGGLLLGLCLWGAGQRVWAANWTVTPVLQWQETWSDNIALAAPGLERSDLVTQLNPGLHVSGQGGRLKANLDALWQVLNYAHGTSANRTLPTLSANGSLELVDKWFYVDGVASMSQQALSPFGPQTTQAANINANNSRVNSYALTPRINGVVGSDLTYDLRYQASQTSTSSSLVTTAQGTNSRTAGWTGGLRWGNASRLFNVAADFSTTSTRFSSGQATTENSLDRVYAYFNPDAHLSFSANVGREYNNGVNSAATPRGSSPTHGVGFNWQPDPRTTISGEHDIRYFGPNDSLSLNHRFRRAALSVAYSRDRTTSQSLLLQNSTSTYYQILSASMTASVPDPVQRDLLVRQVLQSQGLAPNAAPLIGFLSDSILIQRAMNISFAVIGVRNTVTFTASRSNSRTDTVPTLTDVLASYSEISQSNLGLNWAFQVSPYSTLTATLTQTKSDGVGTLGSGTLTRQSAVNILWNSQLGPHSSGSLALRRVNASGSVSGTGGYRESAATATLGYKY
ncbi:MAG: TIGR03016 family PEP-CTERM system-associated outer membrane protein [Rhodocyclaceae bacterium]|nr:TIGR03016 family PEP-CTERM system-associated outer membrane protein [Rhodocyclaceae bacterium]